MKFTTELFVYTALLGIIWSTLALAVILFANFIYERAKGNKQIIAKLLAEKKERDLAERGLKQELNKMIDEHKRFQFTLEPTPQSKQLDKYFDKFLVEN
jgi:hypothetical protein